PKKEDPKKEDPKKEDPKKEDPKKEDPKKEDPKKEDPKLTVEKAVMTTPVTPGELQGFFIEITNNGDKEATNVHVTDKFGHAILGVTSADWATEAGGIQPCNIPPDSSQVECVVPRIAPGETVRIAIQVGMTPRYGEKNEELYGKKENRVEAIFDQGAASDGASYTVVEGPPLSDEEINGLLGAINRCAEDFAALQGGPFFAGKSLLDFAKEVDDQIGAGVDPGTAMFNAQRNLLFQFGADKAMSMVKINDKVSLGDAAKATGLLANCEEFAKQAASGQ
ncbi:hypothetical protein ABT009_31315, partial [Streptomyces sp. NPDC002896]|uniref:hypothetical protein n=1 Tax=Streptomyces sp. NPDC002896 TaxID=3154438 RepID=UPI003323E131